MWPGNSLRSWKLFRADAVGGVGNSSSHWQECFTTAAGVIIQVSSGILVDIFLVFGKKLVNIRMQDNLTSPYEVLFYDYF
jgi:hypothetical protein